MKYLFSIGLIIGLFSIILLSGCVSENKQQDLTDNNWMNNGETFEDEIAEDAYNNAEELMNTVETAEVKDNEIKHCVCHLSEIQYDYWIAKNELARETTFGGKVKQSINKIENCAIQEGIPKQCMPLDFDFEQMKNEWLKETEAMKCNCDIIEYDSKYFN